jgi:hypothetical protein
MKMEKLLSLALAFALIFTTLVVVTPPVNAANGDFTGSAGFTVNAYPTACG